MVVNPYPGSGVPPSGTNPGGAQLPWQQNGGQTPQPYHPGQQPLTGVGQYAPPSTPGYAQPMAQAGGMSQQPTSWQMPQQQPMPQQPMPQQPQHPGGFHPWSGFLGGMGHMPSWPGVQGGMSQMGGHGAQQWGSPDMNGQQPMGNFQQPMFNMNGQGF